MDKADIELQYYKKHNIYCPYCGYCQSQEVTYQHCTYWGDDGEKEQTCEDCGKVFLVIETVDRTWETEKKESQE